MFLIVGLIEFYYRWRN